MKVLWFSRHNLSDAQTEDLQQLYGVDLDINQVNKTINSVQDIAEEIATADILAIVAPLPLQEQFLKVAGNRPVLIPRNHRVPREDGGFDFIHAGWSQLRKIEVVTEVLTEHPAPEGSFRK